VDISQNSINNNNGHSENGQPMMNMSTNSNNSHESQQQNHQQTPPRDPDLRSPQERADTWNNAQQTPTSTTFPVSNSSHDLSKKGNSSGLVLTEEESEER
jgi:hypothetical protein